MTALQKETSPVIALPGDAADVVMNTDNTSISGATFDYGSCAFMNTYHPDTMQQAKQLMNQNNPVYIPRNHLVEQDIIGTIGIILLADKKGLISNVIGIVLRLVNKGFRLSDKMINKIIEKYGQNRHLLY